MTEHNQTIPPYGSQQYIDWVNLRYHERIAEMLSTEPERVLGKARANLKRWLAAYQPGDGAAFCLKEWEELLDKSAQTGLAELIAILTADSDEGQRLRSSTPFVGLFSSQELRAMEAIDGQKAVA